MLDVVVQIPYSYSSELPENITSHNALQESKLDAKRFFSKVLKGLLRVGTFATGRTMSSFWLTSIITFASGIGVSIVAVGTAFLLQKRSEIRRRRKKAAFQVYMLLLDLHGQYFWVASRELRGEPPSPEIASKTRELAWRIADKLRKTDHIPHLEDILTVLMSEDAYKSANDRANALDAVIDRFGKYVNPRYAKAIRRISDENVRGIMTRPENHRSNAPAVMSLAAPSRARYTGWPAGKRTDSEVSEFADVM